MQEPPVIKSLKNMKIERLRETKVILNHQCHNQAVERHVTPATEVSAAVIEFGRNGLITQKIKKTYGSIPHKEAVQLECQKQVMILSRKSLL